MKTIGQLVRGVVARCAEAVVAAAEDEYPGPALRWLEDFRAGLDTMPQVPGYVVLPGADAPQYAQARPVWERVSTPESVAAEIKREGKRG
ncbi:hypothetical protein [Acidocella sp.]|uniref:hypothetical protein n=1 Tax=Acidocella sp. TaxID=50710 RepID=UPI00260401DA|nr:hypothetical protein [Acidocella sp.]MDD2794383.1 hypothetical protein [Acidocella sp.]